jgi:hypothetical protein
MRGSAGWGGVKIRPSLGGGRGRDGGRRPIETMGAATVAVRRQRDVQTAWSQLCMGVHGPTGRVGLVWVQNRGGLALFRVGRPNH